MSSSATPAIRLALRTGRLASVPCWKDGGASLAWCRPAGPAAWFVIGVPFPGVACGGARRRPGRHGIQCMLTL